MNFEDFGSALMTLFRVATMDSWEVALQGSMVTEEDDFCVPSAGNCGSPFAPVFYVAFLVLGSFVMINLYIAIILDNFSTLLANQRQKHIIDRMALTQRVWMRLDPECHTYLHVSKLPLLFARLPSPFGCNATVNTPFRMLNFLRWVDAKLFMTDSYEGSNGVADWCLSFDNVVLSLVKCCADLDVNVDGDDDGKHQSNFDASMPTDDSDGNAKGSAPTVCAVYEFWAAQIMQRKWLPRLRKGKGDDDKGTGGQGRDTGEKLMGSCTLAGSRSPMAVSPAASPRSKSAEKKYRASLKSKPKNFRRMSQFYAS
jgi:hypothetical protein